MLTGDDCRRLRTERGLQIKQLAEQMGVSAAAISRIEHETAEMGPLRKSLAAFFGGQHTSPCKWCAAGIPINYRFQPGHAMHMTSGDNIMRHWSPCRSDWTTEEIRDADEKESKALRRRNAR